MTSCDTIRSKNIRPPMPRPIEEIRRKRNTKTVIMKTGKNVKRGL